MNRLLSRKVSYPLYFLSGFALFFLASSTRQLTRTGNIVWNAGYLTKLLAISLVGGLFGAANCALMRHTAMRQSEAPAQAAVPGQAPRFCFPVCFALIALSFLPYYLAYFPGICAYDSYIQIGQIYESSYNTHHPLFHTLILRLFLEIGEGLFGAPNAGIALYTLAQLLCLAAVFALGIRRAAQEFARRKGPRAALIAASVLTALTMLFPFHGYLAVSVTKDIPFTICLLLFLYALSDLMRREPASFCPVREDTCLLFSGVLMILFRNNGIYVLLFGAGCLFFVLLFHRRSAHRRLSLRIFLLLLITALGGFAGGRLLARATNATPGDRREMLSVPIQQFARVMIYHGGVGLLPEDDNTLDEDSKALIRDFLLDDSYLLYDPGISDPVKRHTNTYVARYDSSRFIKTYFRLLVKYPGDYVNAYLGLYAGFLDPLDESHAAINLSESETGLGYVQTRWHEIALTPHGIVKASLLPGLHESMEKWAATNAYLQLPILKYLFMPGIWFWILVFYALYLLMTGRRKELLPAAILAGYYLTMLLGPTVQLRYIYPVMVSLYLLIPAVTSSDTPIRS